MLVQAKPLILNAFRLPRYVLCEYQERGKVFEVIHIIDAIHLGCSHPLKHTICND